MKIDLIFNELNYIKKFHSKLIQESRCQKDESSISWQGYNAGINKFLYAKEFRDNINQRQFSFLLNDNSHFQFFYSFKEDNLVKAKLSYFPVPIASKENIDIDKLEEYFSEEDDLVVAEYYHDLWKMLSSKFDPQEDAKKKLKKLSGVAEELGLSKEEMYEDWLESKYEMVNTSHFRIDYDSKVETHNKTEIQFGGVNRVRFPFDRLISPFIFFEFVLKNLYKNYFEEIQGNRDYKTFRAICVKSHFKISGFKEKNMFLTHPES